MEYRRLGRTGLDVSALCLGSMTWGTQNSEAEGHAQIDRAVGAGINFIDTAEMYPTNPAGADTVGDTEAIIGNWLRASGRRNDVVIATKITGEGNPWLRGGADIDSRSIPAAVEGSLKRLRCDHIDLYQLHWPNRGSYHFRKAWGYDPTHQDAKAIRANMLDTLEALQKQVEAGRIRHIGLSNESAWGTAQFLRLAEENGLPRVASIQNEYNLLYRTFDLDLAELAHNEDVGLLAYSPLAAGLLTGKYRDGEVPPGSRRSITANLGGRYDPHAFPAIDAYVALAGKHGLHPVELALRFCLSRPFMASVIIGARTMEQLEIELRAAEKPLSTDVLADIAAVHRRYPMPI